MTSATPPSNDQIYRITLESAVSLFISSNQQSTTKLTNYFQEHLEHNSNTPQTTEPSQQPLSTQNLVKLLEMLPYGVNICIFENVTYHHLQSLCKSQNSNIRSAAITCLTQKLTQKLNISHTTRKNCLDILDLLFHSFTVLSTHTSETPLGIKCIFEEVSFDCFLNNLEAIQCNQLLLLNKHLLNLKKFLNSKAIELFLKMFNTKIYSNKAQLALFDENTLHNHVRTLLSFAFETQDLEFLKLGLLFYPKITKLNPEHIKFILFRSAIINFTEYTEIIVDHLFKTLAPDEDRSITVLFCVFTINYYALFNKLNFIPTLLNKMPLRQEEAMQAIKTLQSNSDDSENYRKKFETCITMIKNHYNI